jgi:hypothetical protein
MFTAFGTQALRFSTFTQLSGHDDAMTAVAWSGISPLGGWEDRRGGCEWTWPMIALITEEAKSLRFVVREYGYATIRV